MGIDALIYFKTFNGSEPHLCDALPQGCSLRPADSFACAGSTHSVDQLWRYYGPGYERGPWPHIAAVLMTLHASPDVEAVWYYGDCEDGCEPFTPQLVQKFTDHYMSNGDRPYRRKFQ
jgi:hypothetical protein